MRLYARNNINRRKNCGHSLKGAFKRPVDVFNDNQNNVGTMMRIANVSVSCERVSQLVLNVAPSDKNIYKTCSLSRVSY